MHNLMRICIICTYIHKYPELLISLMARLLGSFPLPQPDCSFAAILALAPFAPFLQPTSDDFKKSKNGLIAFSFASNKACPFFSVQPCEHILSLYRVLKSLLPLFSPALALIIKVFNRLFCLATTLILGGFNNLYLSQIISDCPLSNLKLKIARCIRFFCVLIPYSSLFLLAEIKNLAGLVFLS